MLVAEHILICKAEHYLQCNHQQSSAYQKTHIFFGGGSEWGTHLTSPKPNRWTRVVMTCMDATGQPNAQTNSIERAWYAA